MAEIETTFRNAKVSICATPSRNLALTQNQFEAMTWEEIANVVTVPALSIEEEMQQRQYVNQLGVHMKGGRIGATTEIVVGRNTSDDGYNALVAASKTTTWYPMRIEIADSPNTATTTNTFQYALVLIGRASLPSGGVNDDVVETFPIAVQSDPVIVPPEAI